jgi:hypothetical protein
VPWFFGTVTPPATPTTSPSGSWTWTLVEALVYAGASLDPTAVLAVQRFARIRDEELRRGRW